MRDVYSFVEEQEIAFRNKIPLEDGWMWNFADHIKRSFLYKNSQFLDKNEDRDKRPYKNIVRPILNIQYRTEGFDVKDIELYVDNSEEYYKSFLVKKFHDMWALKNEIDTFIDELVESFVDYGGVLVKNVKGIRPEVVDLRTIAFSDQTDFLSGPFAIKHYMSPSQLREMTEWGKESNGANIDIETLILKAEPVKDNADHEVRTPGRYIEVYEVHNVSEMDYDPSSEDDAPAIHIVAFYEDSTGKKNGVTLFTNPEPKLPFKFLKRDPIQGRALGFGGIEELFEAQSWTNFAEVAIAEMLDHASKTFYKSSDPKFKGQNLTNAATGKVFDITPNTDIAQIDNAPRNLDVFSAWVVDMHEHASEMGAASDLFLGQQPTSGTPFKSVEAQLIEGKSLHLWRQGRIAVFMDEIYRDWVIPHLGKEIVKGVKFLATLSADEMAFVANAMVINKANDKIKQSITKGKLPTPEEVEVFKEVVRNDFLRGGEKQFLELLKDEITGENLNVSTNIAGKQKNLALLTDKVVNILRQFLATPEMRQDPEMVKLLNTILESSGLSPVVFGPRLLPVKGEGSASTEGLKELSKANEPA